MTPVELIGQTIIEWIALVLILLLCLFAVSDRAYPTPGTRSYRRFLSMVVLTIVSGLIVHLCDFTGRFAFRALYSALRMCYILLAAASVGMGCVYVLAEVIPQRSSQHAYHTASRIIFGSFLVYALTVLSNPWTKLYFSLDDVGLHEYTTMAWFPVVLYVIDLVVLQVFTRLYCSRHSNTARSSVRLYTAIALLFSFAYALLPDIPLTGITLSLLAMVLFICFQRQRVHRDRLTGCGTREALFTRIDRMIDHHQLFTLQQVSLRRFRHVNRRFGMSLGDQLLKQVADMLASVCAGDNCYRYNGTDFVILHEHAPNEGSMQETSRLMKRFTESWDLDGLPTYLGASFAQVSYPDAGLTREELISNLEYCQRRGRELEGRSMVVFNESIRKEMTRRDHIIEAISEGMANDRFFLVYQPIYDPYHDRPCAAEALLRLRDADGSIVSPGVFIPAAEENGAILTLTWIVVEKVCRFLHEHRDVALPPISINFSVQQFLDRGMCARIAEILDRYAIDPRQIKIEITERVFSEDNDVILRNVNELKALGVGLYLDDFGTGYSNLSSVIRLPFEVVKVDKSLLSAREAVRPDMLLHAIVSGLKHLGAQVAIEGVETDEQSRRAREMGVDRIQGFLYARPMEAADFLCHIAEHRPDDDCVFHVSA